MTTRNRILSLCTTIALFTTTYSSAQAVSPKAPTKTRASTTHSSGGHPRPIGVGAILGDPTALSGKYWLNQTSAVDAGLAFFGGDFYIVTADYLYHFPGIFGRDKVFIRDLTPYLGGGAVLLMEHNSNNDRVYFSHRDGSMGMGLRVPLGIEWIPQQTPLGVFVEVAPGFGLMPTSFGLFEFGVGARYYF